MLNNTTKETDGSIQIAVMPITHLKPDDTSTAIEISAAEAVALSLDSETSWIIANDINYFTWVGPDVEQNLATGDYEVGFLAPDLLRRVAEKFKVLRQLRRIRYIPRDDKTANGEG